MIITGAVYISQLLKVIHTLQDLNLSQNNISDDGIAVISEALQHNKSLTELWVGRCGLSVKGTVVCIFKIYLLMHKKITTKHLDLQKLNSCLFIIANLVIFGENDNLCIVLYFQEYH